MNSGWVELPHFHVLARNTRTQCHADAVTGVDVRVGGRGINATRTAGCQHGRFSLDHDDFAGLDFHGDQTNHSTVVILDQVNRKPFV